MDDADDDVVLTEVVDDKLGLHSDTKTKKDRSKTSIFLLPL